MNRPWQLWLSFGICLTVVLAALAWTSTTVLRLEEDSRQARNAATLEEDVRLALWRIDSWLSTQIAQENARNFRFYDAQLSKGLWNEATAGSPFVRLYFQVQADGTVTSPQVANHKAATVGRAIATTDSELAADPERNEFRSTSGHVDQATERLAELRTFLDRDVLLAAAPPVEHGPVGMPPTGIGPAGQELLGPDSQLAQRESPASQLRRNQQEFQARSQSQPQTVDNVSQALSFPEEIRASVFAPLWIGERLVLVRRIERSKQAMLQGCWMDWTSLRQTLLSSVQDLLPAASLAKADSQASPDPGRMLAALPVRLVPGPRDAAAPISSPIQLSLVLAWACTLAAAVAVGLLLWGVVSLSARRDAFVSAVTHELRTPLTTFRMYSEMLAAGMVTESQRQHYLDTLRVEADRLMHLVDNVLAYARLERGRAPRPLQSVAIHELLAYVTPRLQQRTEEAGMRLVVRVAEPQAAMHARCDTAAVEQILFNLVDNACKYAARPQGVIELAASVQAGQVHLCVRDEGPGISPQEARRLFRPFHKSARDAAVSAPGVGLGLALSRRLARDQSGDLRLDPSPQGAKFVLTLTVA